MQHNPEITTKKKENVQLFVHLILDDGYKCDNSFVVSQLSTDHFVTILVEKILTNGHFHKHG